MSKYIITEVASRRDLMKFIRFPDELYRDSPEYVPALHSDQIHSLTKVSTLSYCKRRMWMVLDGKKVVGRICAMINPRYNNRYGTRRARFGWFDTVNDLEVAKLLIGTAEAWAREEGMDEIHGPLYYNTLGKQGMLVEGFENVPPFNCIYNYPYYNDLVSELGFVKECDWLQYKVKADAPLPSKVDRLSKLLRERYDFRFVDIDSLKKDKELVRKFFKVYNESFSSQVYNFVPFTDEEIDEEAKSVIPLVSGKSSTVLMDRDGEIIGFAINFPSISQALQKARGRLFPFGWYHLLRAMNDYSVTDLMLNGVVPQWQNKGVSAVYMKDIWEKAARIGMITGITNPQIETNTAVNVWTSFESEPYMRRRCYIKKIN